MNTYQIQIYGCPVTQIYADKMTGDLSDPNSEILAVRVIDGVETAVGRWKSAAVAGFWEVR